jgi:oxygen-independent coproporphyrinogen-3 oxidase
MRDSPDSGNERLGVYVHVPFCRRKCPYCDFYSRPPKDDAEPDAFLAAVIREAGLHAERGSVPGPAAASRSYDTVYVGGGTPSLLGAERLTRLLNALLGEADPGPSEITVEANPLDVTPPWAGAARRGGFDRISIGVQSVDDADLQYLGRLHRAADGPRAASIARRAGFDDIGIDLIYGLPGQTPDMLEERVRRAVESCRPTHVSCYQLTYHRGTPLWSAMTAGRHRRLSEDEQYELFVTVHRTLEGLGYPAYEVSNFSLGDEHRSRHNSNYWRHVPYVGFGPSAHSFDGRTRSWNVSTVDEYLARLDVGRLPTAESEALTDGQLAAEAVMLALRTTDGLDLASFRDRFGRDLLDGGRAAIDVAIDRRLLTVDDGCLRPTLDGLAVADRLAAELT